MTMIKEEADPAGVAGVVSVTSILLVLDLSSKRGKFKYM
jgi:hypothetical protein